MKQYVIIAKDGNDEQALDRRMAARAQHLEGAAKLKATGNLISAGATFNESGTMDGSVVIVQFENDEAFDNWYKTEPYILQDVWKTVEIKPIKLANL